MLIALLAICCVREVVEISMTESDLQENITSLVGFLQHFPGFDNTPTTVTNEVVSILCYAIPLVDDLSKVYIPIIKGIFFEFKY
jgi:hypothetical protein